jgi:Mn-dependent DtxR family transcriptional regulator
LETGESAENYLETILILTNRDGFVRSVDVANELCFSKPSVSVAMRKLREAQFILVDDNGYITLTDKGRSVAEVIYERHTLLTDWLVFLGVGRKKAEEDACQIEHIISAESFEAIKKHSSKRLENLPTNASLTDISSN